MNLSLENKRALVTGGTRGIGQAIALTLRAEGCWVAVCAREVFPRTISTARYDLALRANCDTMAERERVFAVVGVGQGIDILVNNVGGLGRVKSIPDNVQEWQAIMNRNAWAAAHFTMMALPGMIKRGWGRVVTIASIHGKEAGGTPWFTMAKAAEIAFMKSLAIQDEYRPVTFNTVCPGPIRVGNPRESGRMGEPEDVAHLVAFLCSDKARWISGACIVVDGGESRSF